MGKKIRKLTQFIVAAFPPTTFKHRLTKIFTETEPNHLRRHTGDDSEVGDIFRHNCTCTDDSTDANPLA